MVLDQKTCSLVRCLLCAICYIASLTALTACSYTEFRLFYDLRNQVKACLVLREAPRSHLQAGSVLIPSGTTMALNKLGVLVRIEYLSLAY